MREKTVNTFIERCNDVVAKKMTRNSYTIKYNLSAGYFYVTWNNILKAHEEGKLSVELFNKAAEAITMLDSAYAIYTQDGEKYDDGKEDYTTIDRDENNKIISYSFKINKKNRKPLIGKLSRDEMEVVCRLYTSYGQNLTKKSLSKYFPEWSLEDFKRILTAWNIYKDSCPLPPHVIEEHNPEEILEIQYRNKEADIMKKIEQKELTATRNLLNKIQNENIELKQKLNSLDSITLKVTNDDSFTFKPNSYDASNNIILYLADMHIGARVCSGTMYDENKNYGEEEVNRRLDETLKKLSTLGKFDNIIICLMGDNMDSVGITNKTVSLAHSLPENMDGYEQMDVYLRVMHRFIKNLSNMKICNNIKMYSVMDGNHTGVFEHAVTRALFGELKRSGIECTLFKEFFGTFKVNTQTFCITHGKFSPWMKKGMPLNLDDKNKVKMFEWFDSKGIYGNGIHVVKADLHQNNINACLKFDYRNVLSLFGASDYSSSNFNRSSYGVSYDMFIGDNLVRGTFENM